MTDLPIKSYHCTTTHSACDCVLKRLKKLEKVAEAAKGVYKSGRFDNQGNNLADLAMAFDDLERE